MIKAIIFDCFGVLTTEAFNLFRDKYLGDDEPKRQQANKAMDDLNMGLISYDDFVNQLAEVSGAGTNEVLAILEENQPNELLFGYIRTRLKPQYKIGMLSNAGDDWISEMFKPEDIALLDNIVLSFRAKVIKPQPEAYRLVAREMGVKPTECVFIDDRQKYCEGAKVVGMKSVLYDDFPQMKRDLEMLLAAGPNN